VEVGIQRFFNFVSTHHEVIERVHYTSMKRDWTISEMQLQAECLEHCEENEIKFNFLLGRLVEYSIVGYLGIIRTSVVLVKDFSSISRPFKSHIEYPIFLSS